MGREKTNSARKGAQGKNPSTFAGLGDAGGTGNMRVPTDTEDEIVSEEISTMGAQGLRKQAA